MAKNIDHQLYNDFKDMYEGLMKGNMKIVLKQYDKLPVPLPKNLTVFGDTLLHIAIYMGQEDIARKILKRYVHGYHQDLIRKENNVGDTVLHEVAATNMVSLAKDLLDNVPELLSSSNELGETPLFKAAYNGQLDMFDVLSLAVNLGDKDNLNQHLTRKDKTNILHMTILAEFFDLAFIIAKKYPDLVDKKDGAGKIGLQLLSNNPSAFLSSKNYGLLKRLIFKYCVPTSIEHKKKGHLHELDHHIHSNYELDSSSDDNEGDPDTTVREMPRTYTRYMSIVASVLTRINISIWTFLRAWSTMNIIYKDYRKHEEAFRLAELLIKKDTTWEINLSKDEDSKVSVVHPKRNPTKEEGDAEKDKASYSEVYDLRTPPTPPTSLLTATSNGIVEIVQEILRVYPQAVEHVSDVGQNILHIAIKHRQLEIFNDICKKELPRSRLVRRIDDDGYTILHHVGVTNFYTGGTLPGPALKLQEELRWFQRVEDVVPHHYKKHLSTKKYDDSSEEKKSNKEDETSSKQKKEYDDSSEEKKSNKENETSSKQKKEYDDSSEKKKSNKEDETSSKQKKEYDDSSEEKKSNKEDETLSKQKKENEGTAYDLFDRTHKVLRQEAEEWLKNTSKSCSTVAVLIATVAFAAAYTIPGGSDSKTGAPILLHDPFFLVFTVMDVLSLATSLTSVVMFLSILTSPFELPDFRDSLPRKLILGFTFLFISVAMTMLAFAATIVLIIRLKKRWITILVYSLAFLPVTLFALLQYPLYLAFMGTINNSWNMIKKYLPSLPRLSNKGSVHKQD